MNGSHFGDATFSEFPGQFPFNPELPIKTFGLGGEGRVYSRARLCGISAIQKAMPNKIYVGTSNGSTKLCPRRSTNFLK